MRSPHNQFSIDCNVRIQVLGTDGKLKSDQRFKNTATRRMTDGIALFLAGDGAVEHRGAWRPNFISFGTTGILKQPTTADGLAVVEDTFEDKNLPEGQRTRPWFYSTWLGERCPINQRGEGVGYPPERNGCWDSDEGWRIDTAPFSQRTFQGELVSWFPNDVIPEGDPLLRRHPILRSEVTIDIPSARDISPQGYATDCILYGYSSVRWCNHFFKPGITSGAEIPRLAISEVGLFEKDSYPQAGLKTMMAGFRVPRREDIIYVSPDEVMLVVWRITIRALMPSEGVSVVTENAPTGIVVRASVEETPPAGISGVVDLDARVLPGSEVRQDVSWMLSGNDPTYPETKLTITGNHSAKLYLQEGDHTPVLYVVASSAVDPNVHSKVAIITGMVTNVVTGLAVSMTEGSAIDREYKFLATVLGLGDYPTAVTWELTSDTPHSPETVLIPDPEHPDDSRRRILHVAQDELATEFSLVVTSVSNDDIQSVAAVIQIDVTQGSYVVTDFSILTE